MTKVLANYAELARVIAALPPRCGTIRVVAIDGRGGAGKTSFAARLARALGDAPIVHTDDFASWQDPTGWWSRLEAEVLEPLERGQPGRYRAYDWTTRSPGQWRRVPVAPVVILEGVSAGRTEATDRLTYTVWIDARPQIRLQRGIQRDGEAMRPDWELWMAEEDAFFARDQVEVRSDRIVDGNPSVPHDPEHEYVAVT